MGTGFFNIYRQCEYIIIQTISGNVVITIEVRPIYLNNKIIDLQYNMATYGDDGNRVSNGTNILIKFIGLKNRFIDVSLYVNGVLRNIDYPLMFNNKKITNRKRVINKNKFYTLYYDPGTISQVLTNGVPFDYIQNVSYINDTMKSLVPTGFVLDINKPYYITTQSRSIIDSNDFSLNSTLVLGVIYSLIDDLCSKFLVNKLLPHMNSQAEYNQLKLSTSYNPNNDYGFVLNRIYQDNISVKRAINDVIDSKIKSLDYNSIRNAIDYKIQPLVIDLIVKWFSNKQNKQIQQW